MALRPHLRAPPPAAAAVRDRREMAQGPRVEAKAPPEAKAPNAAAATATASTASTTSTCIRPHRKRWWDPRPRTGRREIQREIVCCVLHDPARGLRTPGPGVVLCV
jgi:hypothetical protein